MYACGSPIVAWAVLTAEDNMWRPGIGRCAGEDSVIVLGKALRFHQRFAASIRTGIEVGLAGGLP